MIGGEKMPLIFNNLIINKNSKKYVPFLVNLVSGRRRMLGGDELAHISSMLHKENILAFTNEETALYKKLMNEKQFLNNQQRNIIEERMLNSNYFSEANKLKDDFFFKHTINSRLQYALSLLF